jgi:hypothetical protein
VGENGGRTGGTGFETFEIAGDPDFVF